MYQRKDKELHIAAAIGIGAVASILTTLVLTAFAAWLVANDRVDRNAYALVKIIITAMATTVGCLISTKLSGKKRLPTCVLTGTAYLLVLLASTAMLFEEQYSGVPVSAAVIGTVSCLTAFLKTIHRTGKRKFNKKVYR